MNKVILLLFTCLVVLGQQQEIRRAGTIINPPTNTITGNGTANRFVIFNNSTNIGNGSLVQSGGTNVTNPGNISSYSITTTNGGTIGSLVVSGTNSTLTGNFLAGSGVLTNGLILPNSTAGGVFFAGTGGTISQNATRLFWNDSTFRFGINTNTPGETFHVVAPVAGNAGIMLTGYGTDAAVDVRMNYQRANGTQGSPTIVSSGDKLRHIIGNYYDGAAFRVSTEIRSVVDGTPASNDMPGRLEFYTRLLGAGGSSLRMTIKGNGNTLIGSSSDLGGLFQLTSTTANQFTIFYDSTHTNSWTVDSSGNGNIKTGGGTLNVTGALTSSGLLTGGTGLTLSAGDLNVPGGADWIASGRGRFGFAADGVLLMRDSAGTSFGRLQFGGTTASFPAIKRSAATLAFRLADDSADAGITTAGIVASSTIDATQYKISTSVVLGSTGLLLRGSGYHVYAGSSSRLNWSDNVDGGFGTTDTALVKSAPGTLGIANSTLTPGTGSLLTSNITLNGFSVVPSTITAPGTTTSQTINKMSGRVNIAATGTSAVVTNSIVTANSIITAVAATADVTARVTSVVAASGQFTINTVATTAETAFNFIVITP